MQQETVVSVDHVSRYYGNYRAVNDLSFTIRQGEITGLIGPNGAGKSTTMQLICGVLALSEGQISVADFDVVVSPKAAKKQIGFLPERPPLYFDLSVDEYLYYAARLRGINSADVATTVEKSKQRCGLTKTGRRLISNLSKGFQQRVGIAQAIIHSPAVIILDEPTSGLDPNQILEIHALICELGRDHSIILSTHILPEIRHVCERVLIINEGRLVLDKRLTELQQDSNAFKIALRQPPTTDVIGAVEGVTGIEKIGSCHFKIRCAENEPTIRRLIQQAVKANWDLYELIPEQDILEQTFVKLTCGEVEEPAS